MNVDRVRNLLIPALLSGEYKQGFGSLHDGNAFCCLGVATDIAIKEGLVEGEWLNLYESSPLFYFDYDPNYLSIRIQELFGFNNKFGDSLIIDGYEKSLANHNDEGATFSDIAEALELACQSQEARSGL